LSILLGHTFASSVQSSKIYQSRELRISGVVMSVVYSMAILYSGFLISGPGYIEIKVRGHIDAVGVHIF